jgi:APA family basic amino acid/polyamine antiporter
MARRGEVPRWFAHVDPARALPARAELTIAAIVVVLAATTDLRGVLGLSGVAVLTYYAITNASALRLAPAERRWPRPLAILGLLGCVTLAVALVISWF